MHMIGEDNPSVDAEGRAGAHPANPVAQYVDLRHQQIRTGIAQVHCKEEGSARNPIAAIIRHTGSMPELSERRNAPPRGSSPRAKGFSALRLLLTSDDYEDPMERKTRKGLRVDPAKSPGPR
jgi:hypothetical protein